MRGFFSAIALCRKQVEYPFESYSFVKVFVWNIHIINPFAGAVCGELTGEFQKSGHPLIFQTYTKCSRQQYVLEGIMQELQALQNSGYLGKFLNPLSVKKLTEWQVKSSKSDHYDMVNTLAELECHIEEVATGFDQFEVTSDQDRKALGDFAVKMFKVVKGLDQNIGYVKALSEKSSWRQEVYTKLEHLANQVEDIAETAALSSRKEFTRTVLTEIQNLTNVSPED